MDSAGKKYMEEESEKIVIEKKGEKRIAGQAENKGREGHIA